MPQVRPARPFAFLLAVLLLAGAAAASEEARRRTLERLGVPAWHDAGHRGRGVKVAILDSGFQGYRSLLGRGLPRRVTARSFRADGDIEARGSQHGVLCGEVVHALAPEAELLFANWEPGHPDTFLEAVRWARNQGARILSCSIIMPTWSDGEGGGPVHAELTRLLGNGSGPADALFFACAGNTADRHWSGPFKDTGAGDHAWADDRTDNLLVPWGTERVSVELCARDLLDLELSVHDHTSDQEVGRADVRHGDYRCAVVRFTPQSGHEYHVRVRASGRRTGPFHLFVLGGNLSCSRLHGSIPFPGDGAEAITVGAVESDGGRAAYSSCGPNSPRPKPDLVATVPFASLVRERPFAGTSAATPQAAGMAALLWSARPDRPGRQVREELLKSARDLGLKGHDWETGHGHVALPDLPGN